MDFRFIVRFTMFFLVLFICLYIIFWGKFGVSDYLKAKKKVDIEKQKILKLNNKIEKINNDIKKFSKLSFELEKTARQDLQMGLANETVYIVANKKT